MNSTETLGTRLPNRIANPQSIHHFTITESWKANVSAPRVHKYEYARIKIIRISRTFFFLYIYIYTYFLFIFSTAHHISHPAFSEAYNQVSRYIYIVHRTKECSWSLFLYLPKYIPQDISAESLRQENPNIRFPLSSLQKHLWAKDLYSKIWMIDLGFLLCEISSLYIFWFCSFELEIYKKCI